MRSLIITSVILFSLFMNTKAQTSFDYQVELTPVHVANLPGLQSYVFAQHDNKWIIIGGRKDGLHARQPFNAFPLANNNSTIYVVDINTNQSWSVSLSTLSTSIQEQLQSTNMSFYQDEDSLYIIGGYAFSPTANDHITFDKLTSVNVSGLMDAIINGNSIIPYFKQISDSAFAVTGAQLGKIGNTFYLVGGQKFMGRYNPMGNPTYTQTYSNQIRKFTLDNSSTQLSFSNYSTITDAVHLRRRDYNLLPQIYPNGEEGYMISSGVFQMTTDLPFLYPVDIKVGGYTPQTTFNQYLSNYHSAKVALFDSINNNMHSLFFGGMSQYYYQNGALIQDNNVPFVKTISRVSRDANGNLQEYQLPKEMPDFKGAGAEFIPNNNLPHTHSEIIKLNPINQDTILIGHIFGGIKSSSLNPFTVNQTTTTSADTSIFAVRLIKQKNVGFQEINGRNPYEIMVYPNPVSNIINIGFNATKMVEVEYYISNSFGQIIQQDEIIVSHLGENTTTISLENSNQSSVLYLTLVFENKFFITKTLNVK